MTANEKFLSCEAGCIDDGKLYTIHRFHPTLLRYDLSNLTYEVVTFRVMSYESRKRRIVSMFKKAEKLYIVLNDRLGNVVVYDFLTDTYEEYLYPGFSNEKVSIWYAYNDENDIYIFPTSLKYGHVKYNICEKKITEIVDLKFSTPINYDKYGDSFGRRLITDKGIFAFPLTSNSIIRFSNDGDELCRYDMPRGVEIENVAYHNQTYFFTTYTDYLIRAWKPDEGIIEEYHYSAINKDPKEPLNVLWMRVTDNAILSVPQKDGMISLINRNTKEELILDFARCSCFVQDFSKTLFSRGVVVNDHILLFPYMSDSFLWINIRSGDITPVSARFKEDDIIAANYFLRKERNKIDIVNESKSIMTLGGFINAVKYI